MQVSSAVGVMGSAFNLSVPNPRLWWPRNLGEPFNYDIEVSLYAAANSTAPKSAAAAKSVTNFATQARLPSWILLSCIEEMVVLHHVPADGGCVQL